MDSEVQVSEVEIVKKMIVTFARFKMFKRMTAEVYMRTKYKLF